MKPKHIFFSLVLFLAAALALFWLITMASPTAEPSNPTPAPVPLAPASQTPAEAPHASAPLPSAASLQPQPQPIPTPAATPVAGSPAVQPRSSRPAFSAASYLLVLLAVTGIILFTATRLSSSKLEASGI